MGKIGDRILQITTVGSADLRASLASMMLTLYHKGRHHKLVFQSQACGLGNWHLGGGHSVQMIMSMEYKGSPHEAPHQTCHEPSLSPLQ